MTETAVGGGLGELDQEILEALAREGRATHRRIAAEVQSGEATVRSHLRRLQDDGIARVVAAVDLEALGYPLLAVLHMRVAGRGVAETGAEVAQLPEAIAVSVATGPFGLIVSLVARDGPHLADLLGKAIPRIAGVVGTRCELALDYLRFAQPWALLDGSVPAAAPPPATAALDDLDQRIIALLRADGRMSFRKVAAAVGVTDSTVRSRVARLENEGMIAFELKRDAGAFGVMSNAYVGIQVEDGRIDEVAAGILACENVTTLMRTLGDFHFVCIVQAASRDELMETIVGRIAALDGVRRVETSEIWRLLKHVYTLRREAPSGYLAA